jgi:hypothetical protein
MSRSEIMNLYLDYLRDEGYRPGLDRDGDIKFKHEGRTYLLLVDEQDTACVRLIFPNFWGLDTPDEKRKAVEAAERATAETKVSKVYLVGDNVWAAFEMLCTPPETLKAVFARAIRTLKTASSKFAEQVRKSVTVNGLVGRVY